jgi:hypothetical protein
MADGAVDEAGLTAEASDGLPQLVPEWRRVAQQTLASSTASSTLLRWCQIDGHDSASTVMGLLRLALEGRRDVGCNAGSGILARADAPQRALGGGVEDVDREPVVASPGRRRPGP